MKIEKLDANKIKITLSELDLVDMNINVNLLTPNSPKLHNFLYEVMERVREETGFNPYTGQVVVEATPSNDGITLVVTKISEQPPAPTPTKRKPKNIRAVKAKSTKKLTYKFRSFEQVLGLFSISQPENFSNGELFEYMESFYIVIPPNPGLRITEFADMRECTELSESFLAEHGKLHAKEESLVSMAKGVREMESHQKGVEKL